MREYGQEGAWRKGCIANRGLERRGVLDSGNRETPNPEFPIAPRAGPMVLVPGHQEGGLGKGRLYLSFSYSGPEALS
jgi:hypothetical protein